MFFFFWTFTVNIYFQLPCNPVTLSVRILTKQKTEKRKTVNIYFHIATALDLTALQGLKNKTVFGHIFGQKWSIRPKICDNQLFTGI